MRTPPDEIRTALPCDVIKHIVDFDDQMQTIVFDAGHLNFGSFRGAMLRPGVFACNPEHEEWFHRHVLIDDDYDEEMLEHEYACSGDFDWSTIFRTNDGRIFGLGGIEAEGFNDWNPSFELHCIGRLVEREMSIAPFSCTLGKSFACSRRDKHVFGVELYDDVFITHEGKDCTIRTRFHSI